MNKPRYAQFSGLRILVVEDEPFLNKVICQFISFKSGQGIECFDLATAREMLREQNFELVMLDQHLPDGRGLDLLNQINNLVPPVPVIMMSGDDDQALMVEAFEAGVEDFLLKPINFELAWLKIQRLVANHELQREVESKSLALEKMIYDKRQEERLALHMYEHVLATTKQDHTCVEWVILTNTEFSGDLVLSRWSPAGNLYVLVADATGHGLAAALSALPLITTFSAMVDKGVDLSNMIYTLNQKMVMYTPDDRFVAAILIEINIASGELLVWNGGMPEVLLLDAAGIIQQRFPARHMALGILGDWDLDALPEQIPLPQLGALVLCSDGLLEQESSSGETFGCERWYQFIAAQPPRSLGDVMTVLSAFTHRGTVSDDVTLCRINLVEVLEHCQARTTDDQVAQQCSGSLQWQLCLRGDRIATHDVLEDVNVFLKNADFERSLCQRVFTVTSELYNNALDHGVLRMDSAIKDQPDGFVTYLDQRQSRLEQLKEHDQIDIEIRTCPKDPLALLITVSDSGDGYDVQESMQRLALAGSGRGLAVLRNLCDFWECPPPGNKTTVRLK